MLVFLKRGKQVYYTQSQTLKKTTCGGKPKLFQPQREAPNLCAKPIRPLRSGRPQEVHMEMPPDVGEALRNPKRLAKCASPGSWAVGGGGVGWRRGGGGGMEGKGTPRMKMAPPKKPACGKGISFNRFTFGFHLRRNLFGGFYDHLRERRELPPPPPRKQEGFQNIKGSVASGLGRP